MTSPQTIDVAVIGAGIGGITALYHARKAGMSALALEARPVTGGLWGQLPGWQDIQNNRTDWTLGDLPIQGEDSASVVANIRSWVDRFGLGSSIRLNAPVTRAKFTDHGWLVSTPGQDYLARFLVCATGAHNRAFVPSVERVKATLRELHSSTLHDPAELGGQTVVIVGGGASAFDLLDLCFAHGAQRVVWVYRSLKWMTPTRKPKHQAADLRGLAKLQMDGVSVDEISRTINQDLRSRYLKFGLADICPPEDFDLGRHQLIPGRRGMIENFARIERHRGEIAGIEGSTVRLSTGERVDAGLLVWATGYEMDLEFFDIPELADTRRIEDMSKRCGSLFVSRDAPDLFFLAPCLLETTAVSPWCYALASRTIVSHMLGHAHLDTTPVNGKVSYFDLANFLAPRDPASFAPDWHAYYHTLVHEYPADKPLPIP